MPLFLQYILTFFGLIFAIGYGYGQYKNGTNQQKIDTITLLTADVKTLREEVEKLTKAVNTLQKENEEEKKKFIEAILILQGKDTTMSEFIKTGNHYMTYSMPVFDRLNKYLDKQIL